jgi:hypothetical protein
MKFHTEERSIERIGTEAEGQFTIKTTAKAFDILSSGLYSDPILAIIRELSCNAYDSHVAAGKADVPFTIHLPNNLEPFLSIRDYGLGLSDEDVLNLYTTYFESTKTNSNDYIGALGLGSKSPFSYASAFEVISRFEGKHNLYSIFLNEAGIPSITRMGSKDTDEENGIEIKITIDSGDFYTFKDRTAEILKYFPTKPEVVGSPSFSFNSLPSNNIKGDGWFVAPKEWSSQRFTAVQGNVPYRVDMSKIRDMLTDEENQFFNNAQIVAFFDIGDLEVAASREEIRYDDRSKEALVLKAREIRADLTAAIEKDIEDVKKTDLWDAYLQLDKYSVDTFGNSDSLRKFVKDEHITNPILKSYIENDRRVVCDHEKIKYWTLVSYARPRYSNTTLPKVSKQVPGKIHPDNRLEFIINDVRMGGIKRTANYLYNKHGISSVVMLKPNDPKEVSSAKTKELNRILKEYGNPPVAKTSEMDHVSPTPQNKTKNTFFTFNGSYTSGNVTRYQWSAITSDDTDAPKKGLYFFLSRGKTPMMGETLESAKCAETSKMTPSQFRGSINGMLELINKAQGTKYTFDDVYGAPVKTLKELQKNKKWTNIFDLARDSLTHFKADAEFVQNWEATPDELGFKRLMSNTDFCDRVNALDADSEFRTLLTPVMKAYDDNYTSMEMAKQAIEFDYLLNGYSSDTFEDGEAYFEQGAFDVYPMLTFVGSIRYDSYDRTDPEVLFDYIQLMDRS